MIGTVSSGVQALAKPGADDCLGLAPRPALSRAPQGFRTLVIHAALHRGVEDTTVLPRSEIDTGGASCHQRSNEC